MSWKDIVKETPPLSFIFIVDGLEKKVYKKYKGNDATKDMVSPYGKNMHDQTRMFIGVSKRLDKIAENPTEEKLMNFMTDYLDFSSASAKRYIDSKMGR